MRSPFNQDHRPPPRQGREPKKIITVGGIDQGRELHAITLLQFHADYPDKINILLADMVGHTEVIPLLNRFRVQFTLLDNEPDRLSAFQLCEASGSGFFSHPLALQGYDYRVALADQRSIDLDFKPIVVTHGDIKLPCYAVNNGLMQDAVADAFVSQSIRIGGKLHPKFTRHLTSVKRDPDSGRWIRPADHEDHLWFATGFALCAARIVLPPRTPKPLVSGDTRQTYKLLEGF